MPLLCLRRREQEELRQQSFELVKDTTTCRQTAAESGRSTVELERVHEEVQGMFGVLWKG